MDVIDPVRVYDKGMLAGKKTYDKAQSKYQDDYPYPHAPRVIGISVRKYGVEK